MRFYSRHRLSNRRPHSRGFILPVTLWIVAAIGLVVVAVNQWLTQAIDNARIYRERADAALAYAGIRDELVFAMATRSITHRGLETGQLVEKIDRTDMNALMAADYQTDRFLRLDGSPYIVESNPDYIVRIYDGRGLININGLSQPYLRRLLGLFELPEQVRNGLIDSLEDYLDRDDLTRISGAEVKEYERLGLPPPANAWLMTPLEAQSVLGWDQLEALWRRDQEAPLLTTCRTSGFNANTASREALIASLPGLVEENLTELLQRRKERPFRNTRELSAAAGTVLREEPFFFTFAPAACVIVDLIHRSDGNRMRFSLTIDNLTSKAKPWQLDYVSQIPPKTPSDLGELTSEEVFPAPDSMDSDQQPGWEADGTRPPRSLDSKSANDAASNF
jgi:general secretion pathway protein K